MNTLLHLDEICCRYGAVTALHPLTLHIAAGERRAIIGPNGAGKSTVLNAIAGTAPLATGRVVFDQQPIAGLTPASRANRGIGRTFQHPGVVDTLTVADNVALAVHLPATPPSGGRRRARDTRRAQVTTALNNVGLEAHATKPTEQLSYGQRRLLEIAMVLAAEPRLLLLDEPSAGLDPHEIRNLAQLIRALPDDIAVIVVDHHLPLVFALADTITVLAAGRHIATGTPHNIRTNPQVNDVYLIPTPQQRPTSHAVDLDVLASPSWPSNPELRTSSEPAPQPPVVLQVERLRAGYHGAPVLHDIDLTVTSGAIHTILGRNGAGKSTLINTIAATHPALPGTQIRLDGIDLPPGNPTRTARHGVALVPQGRHLFASLTIREHLALAARHARRHGRPPGDVRWTTDDALDLLPALRDKLGRYPAQLSGGEQQMAALARALLTSPRLLLLDEPTEGLATAVVDQLTHAITRIADQSVAILLAEQNQHLALAVADQVSVLDHGRIAFTTTARTLHEPATRTRLNDLLGVTTTGSPS
ncbi:ATP-binding cassette domain-containing protein [Winogradskya humida]|uniref:ABC transporter domain-containing protein n=1 Tax=Winogradskya humida TaxID=113566 RepID=A0ABQ4A1T8_9ACTN|nr:ATP-binding cassette domain-containing protein [Actinoplanes humidus]GIE24792.1 hypothetical protein Ahu01nite_078940 [Actinoplanes humidus]